MLLLDKKYSLSISMCLYGRSLAQMSLLFGQVVRGLSAGARVFEVRVNLYHSDRGDWGGGGGAEPY